MRINGQTPPLDSNKIKFGPILLTLVALALVVSFFATHVALAQDSDDSMKVSQQRKAADLIKTAEIQLKRNQYFLAQKTIAQLKSLNGNLNADQAAKRDELSAKANEGLEVQTQVNTLIAKGEQLFKDGDVGQASNNFDKAQKYKDFLPETTQKRIKRHQESIKAYLAKNKKEMKALYVASKKQFKNGELDAARDGFLKIQRSGVKLSLIDRGGDFTTPQSYLKKIEGQKLQQPDQDSSSTEMPKKESMDAETEPVEMIEPTVVETIQTPQPAITMAEEESESSAEVMEVLDAVETPEQSETETTTPSEETAPASTSTPESETNNGLSLWPFKKSEDKLDKKEIEHINLLVQQGNTALENHEFGKAKDYFNQILSIDPENSAAKTGLKNTASIQYESHQQQSTKQSSILDRVRAANKVQTDFIYTSFQATSDKVFNFIKQQQFDEAQAEVSQMIAILENNKQLLGAQKFLEMKNQTSLLFDRISKEEKTYLENESLKQIEAARKEEINRQIKVEAARQKKIDELFAQALEFKRERNYNLAASTLGRLLELDPKHQQAQWMKEDMELWKLTTEQLKFEREALKEEKKVLIDARRSAKPESDHINYPTDWEELTERRLKGQQLYGSAQDQVIYEQLVTGLWSPDFQDLELSQILDQFEAESGINTVPLWGSLEFSGITRDELISLQLTNVTFETALEKILEVVSAGKGVKAGYVIDRGVLTIAIDSELPVNLVPEVYYVADLLTERSDSENSQFGGGGGGGGFGGGGQGGGGFGGGGTGGGGGGFGGGGGGGGFGGGGGGGGTGGGGGGGGGQGDQDIEQRITNLSSLIIESVGFDQWNQAALQQAGGGGSGGGGGIGGGGGGGLSFGGGAGANTESNVQGTIEVYGGTNLFVKQTPKNHRVIRDLLKELRKTLGEQVSIESRFLLINSNFLEDIGVDFDIFLNLGNAGFDQTGTVDNITGRQILQQRANPGPNNRSTPFPINQGSFDVAGSESSRIPGSFGGSGAPVAFSLSGSFLDNVQVDFLIRATNANRRSRTNQAPHVTVFNGEDALVSFGTSQNFVSSLSAQTANRVGLFNPQISSAFSGIQLVITPTISADKRYVILNTSVSQSNVLRIDEFTFNTAGAGGGTATTDGGGLDVGAGGTNSSTASTGTIQQPVVEQNLIQTHVSIPDGGTLLLGGQKVTAEIEKEVGVPALSKIPIVNRLFTNRSKTVDESVLLILIKPKIILQDEEEELRFNITKRN